MKKYDKNQGFTLSELLIVVMIVGVLVSISIPLFSGKLKQARYATNQANIRAAKAEFVAEYMLNDQSKAYSAEYNVESGELTVLHEDQGQGENERLISNEHAFIDYDAYKKVSDHKGYIDDSHVYKIIWVHVNQDGEFSYALILPMN